MRPRLPAARRRLQPGRVCLPRPPPGACGVRGQSCGARAELAHLRSGLEFSVGVGLTNACDLACAHCYRDTERVDELTESQVLGVCNSLPVRSINLGTGENGLHPEYAAIVAALGARGVKLSLTSNGYTIER